MDTIRIPTRVILALAKYIETGEATSDYQIGHRTFSWKSRGGDTLVATRSFIEDKHGMHDVWDFEYNPGD